MPLGTKVGLWMGVIGAVGLALVIGYKVGKDAGREEGKKGEPEKAGPMKKEEPMPKKKEERPEQSVPAKSQQWGIAELVDHLNGKGLKLAVKSSDWRPGASKAYYLFPEGKEVETNGIDGQAPFGEYTDIVHCSIHRSQSAAREEQLLLKGRLATLIWGRFLFGGDEKLMKRISAVLPN